MKSLTMKDAHPGPCEFCSQEPEVLLEAAEMFMLTPEAKLDMATEDFAAAGFAARAKAEQWGF